MATGLSGRSFIAVVKRSGVVSEEELNRSLTALQTRGDVSLDDPSAVANALVEQGIITRWQADKLLLGKTKGYTLGPYKLLDMLGKGGMGAVYLAEHTLMRRRCAIKVLPTKNIGSRSYLERFYREAQAVAALDHPNIVRAYDVNQAKVSDQDVHFLAMEYVEGRDLQRMVDEDGPLSYSQAAEYIRQSAEGLAHAHEANMVHRDIKPANLLVMMRGGKGAKPVVKILDLGLAKFYDDAQEASLTVAHNETVLGTADYLSPEQAVDSHNTDHRADIYSLGCTFYFLLTGHPPFCEGSVANRLMQHQMKPPPPIRDDRPDVPDSLVVIIERMMAKKREDRYQSAKDVADDLLVWLAENGNPEWKEQNTELVRRVQESWRADTKVVTGALVDTAELDLKDEDLKLAPLEGVTETPKESPLVLGGTKTSGSSVHDAELELTPQASAAVGKKSGVKSGIKEATPKPSSSSKLPAAEKQPALEKAAAPAAPLNIELAPLEPPELVSLNDLESLDNLQLQSLDAAQAAAPAPSGLAPLGAAGLAPTAPLGQPARPAAPAKKEAEGLPMPLIIGVICVGVVVVLGVILMILFRDSPTETGPVSQGSAPQVNQVDQTPVAPVPPPGPVTPPSPVEQQSEAQTPPPTNVAPTPQGGNHQRQVAPPEAFIPEAAPEPAPAAIAAPSHDAPAAAVAPPVSDGSANTHSQNAAQSNLAPPAQANTIPPEAAPPHEAIHPVPPAPSDVAPQEAPTPAPLDPSQLSPAEVKELWRFETITVKPTIPDGLNRALPGLYGKIEEILAKDNNFRLGESAPATLYIDYRVDIPKDAEKAQRFSFSVDVRLTVIDHEGTTVELWSDSKASKNVLRIKLINELRDEAATLVRRMLNERRNVLGELGSR